MFNFLKKKKQSVIETGMNESGEVRSNNAENNAIQIGGRNNIKKVIAVISGKGGVGKSTLSALIASGLKMHGYSVGLLDADITGPSIPKMFGINGGKMGKNDYGIVPRKAITGLKIMSLNLFLSDENLPVLWRGPRIGGTVNEFYTQADWGDLDYLILDMPPGTGDIAITVMQNIPLEGAVVVTTPHDLAFSVVRKAYHMLKKHDVPVIGVVENLSVGICPHCKNELELFPGGRVKEWCSLNEVNYLGSLPWDAGLAYCADQGQIYKYYPQSVDQIIDNLIAKVKVM